MWWALHPRSVRAVLLYNLLEDNGATCICITLCCLPRSDTEKQGAEMALKMESVSVHLMHPHLQI